jgi:hypothetical protein
MLSPKETLLLKTYKRKAAAAILGCFVLAACTPTVRVEAPREPITINLNIKLDADVRLRIEEKAEEDVRTNPIF